VSEWEAAGKSDEWYTPAYIFAGLGCHFDLDVAAPVGGPRHVPCDHYYTHSGQSRPWMPGAFVWMNPPFGGRNAIEPWLERFFEHGNGIALTPDRTSAPWFQKWAVRAAALLFVSPKIKFERPDGSTGDSPGSGTCLMAAGERAVDILGNAGCLGLMLLPATDGAALTTPKVRAPKSPEAPGTLITIEAA
jgi:hypothetical protein